MTSVTSQIDALIEAEVARRTASAIAELTAKREECDRLIGKLTEAVTVSDTASVSSVKEPSTPTPKTVGADGYDAWMGGAPSKQLEFIFNHLKPRQSGVIWTMLRAAWNTTPERFELGQTHVSSHDPHPHHTIYYKCPVHRQDGGINDYVIKVHLHITERAGKIIYTDVTALTTIKHSIPEPIASFM